MDHHRIIKHLSSIAFTLSSFIVAADASADPLPCVQRAIDWNNASTQHSVNAVTVSMNAQSTATYAVSPVTNSGCSLPPLTVAGCLTSPGPTNALVNNHVTSIGALPQYFAVGQPLPFEIESLRADNEFVTRFRSASATHNLLPRCIGNLLIGNDEWGNHWTVSFLLLSNP
jgi:hypothetical protein